MPKRPLTLASFGHLTIGGHQPETRIEKLDEYIMRMPRGDWSMWLACAECRHPGGAHEVIHPEGSDDLGFCNADGCRCRRFVMPANPAREIRLMQQRARNRDHWRHTPHRHQFSENGYCEKCGADINASHGDVVL